ncbi:hypothetical protein RGR602_PB00442 (plasmid) [Rhizobium gallicum bv. gallicum R602sp]|uniref:Uncharacterized protein n=1 Tax=Rhizobium gallicum bv. gallicum R602sp TaxID=1041138 RepID=A0A0B4XA48_9HYPH|nr:hypothetical protein RGR602_PB00442 [Rhizobium gallicum bv. gallicum R602sp]
MAEMEPFVNHLPSLLVEQGGRVAALGAGDLFERADSCVGASRPVRPSVGSECVGFWDAVNFSGRGV